MKRFTAAMIAMLLCSCLCACGDSGASTMTSGDVTPPDYIYPFCYDSPSLLKEAMSSDGELYDELSRKGAGSEIIDGFGTFIEKYKSQGMIVPFMNGKEIEFRDEEGYSNISVFPSEAYGLPWVIFYPSVPTGENFYIKLTCLPDSIVKTQNSPTASEAIKIISPDSPNINNVGEQHERIYDRVTELEDRKVTAMVVEYKTDKMNSIFFVYGEMLVEVRCDPAVWDAKWFSCLSFESIAG